MRRKRQLGFTLAEVLISLAISMIVFRSIVIAYIHQQKTFRRTRSMNEVQQNLRASLDLIARDARMAGYGVPTEDTAAWFPWAPQQTGRIVVTEPVSPEDPDTVSIAAALDEPVSSLLLATEPGDTDIEVLADTAESFDAARRSVIFIGRRETARIVSLSGSRLHISTDPVAENEGLKYAYAAGTPIEMIQIVTYRCELEPAGFPYLPCLLRQSSLDDVASTTQDLAGVGIDDLQFTLSGSVLNLSIRARAAKEDPSYTDPAKGDHYWRKTLTAVVSPRNPL